MLLKSYEGNKSAYDLKDMGEGAGIEEKAGSRNDAMKEINHIVGHWSVIRDGYVILTQL